MNLSHAVPQTALASQGLHTDSCPGWYLAKDGSVEACLDCGISEEDAAARASAFFRAQPTKHDPHEECAGCPGFDVFDVRGSAVASSAFAINRSDACGVFDGDTAAIAAAVAACAAVGFVVVDGDRGDRRSL